MSSFEQRSAAKASAKPFRSVEQSREESQVKYGAHERWLLDEVRRLLMQMDFDAILSGNGGEHIVLEIPVRPNPDPERRGPARVRNVVVKINVAEMLDAFSASDLVDPVQKKKGIEKMQGKMGERKGRLKAMARHFGADAVPAQRFIIGEVPISREIIRKARPNWLMGRMRLAFDTMPAWIEIQRRIDLDPENTVSLNGSYLEYASGPFAALEPREADKAYILAHEVLTGLSDLPAERQLAVALRAYPKLHTVVAHMDDPAFASALRDTVTKLISYAEDTEDALDLNGKNNMVLTKTGKGWQLKLLDVLHADEFTFQDLGLAVHAAKDGKRVSTDVVNGVYNAMNTVRVTNALAIIAGLPDRLRIPEIDEASAAGWKQIMFERRLDVAA